MKNKTNPSVGQTMLTDIADTAIRLAHLIDAYMQKNGKDVWFEECHNSAMDIAIAAFCNKTVPYDKVEDDRESEERLDAIYALLAKEGLSYIRS